MHHNAELLELYQAADDVGRRIILNTARRQAAEARAVAPKLSLIDCSALRLHFTNVGNGAINVPTLSVVGLAVDR